MLKMSRICIPLGMECNMNCVYCMRDINKLDKVPDMTDKFRKYLSILSKEDCEAVVVTGGEPLLYFDKIVEVFSTVPQYIHKKIMTNGLLLTQEILDYINENKIELYLSYDGPRTEELRGVNVLDNKNIRELVKQASDLTIGCVITNKNNDIVEIYNDIVLKLNRSNFHLMILPMFDTGGNNTLVRNFNYDLFAKTMYGYYSMYCESDMRHYAMSRSTQQTHNRGFNVLLDGTIVGMSTLHKYGTIDDSIEKILKEKDSHEDCKKCNDSKCNIRAICRLQKQVAGDHICKCEKIRIDIMNHILR